MTRVAKRTEAGMYECSPEDMARVATMVSEGGMAMMLKMLVDIHETMTDDETTTDGAAMGVALEDAFHAVALVELPEDPAEDIPDAE